MSPAEIFYLCLAIAFSIFIIPYLIIGDGIALLIIIFPAILAENITRETGLDFSQKSPVYLFLFWIFLLLQIVLVASVLFGMYCLCWGYPIASDSTASTSTILNEDDIIRLKLLNKILLLIEVYFASMFVYHTFKHKETFKLLKKNAYVFNQFIPLLIFPLAFTYLITTRAYLTDYDSTETLGLIPRITGFITAIYVTYVLGRTIFIYSRNFRHGFSGFTVTRALQLIISIGFNIGYLYLFYRIFSLTKI
jgi:hypothetical protein